MKWEAEIVMLESSYMNRRRCIRLYKDYCFVSPNFDVQLGGVKLQASRDIGDTVWIAHTAHGKFYMIPHLREVGRLGDPLYPLRMPQEALTGEGEG